MFEKIEMITNQKLLPIVTKMNQQIHFMAVKKAFVSLSPVFIVGSLSLGIQMLMMILEEKGILFNFNEGFSWLYTLSVGLVSLYATVMITYYLASEYHMDIPVSLFMVVIGFGVTGLRSDGNDKFLGSEGLYFAIIMAFLVTEIFRWCLNKNWRLKLPESVPAFVSKSFEMIPICIIVIGFCLLLRCVSQMLFGEIPPVVLMKFLTPFVRCFDHPVIYTILKIFQCFLFFFGIHPAVLDPITKTISHQFLADNIMHYYNGTIPTHFFSPGVESAFGNFTGTGITIGFVFWCLFSRRQALRKVGRISLIPSLFGVNESILFGAPIVLNPLFFIPFVIGGGLIGSLGGWAIYLGLMRCPFFTPPYFGIFLEAFLTNFDVVAIVVNAVQLVLSIVIWYPFFKHYEKHYNGTGFENLSNE